jgi:hypothetical protein
MEHAAYIIIGQSIGVHRSSKFIYFLLLLFFLLLINIANCSKLAIIKYKIGFM